MRERRVVQIIEELESHAKSFRKHILQEPNDRVKHELNQYLLNRNGFALPKFKLIYNSAFSTQFLTFFFSFLSLSQKCSVSGDLVLGSYANYWDQRRLSKKSSSVIGLQSKEKAWRWHGNH